jgi:hypothetical protein
MIWRRAAAVSLPRMPHDVGAKILTRREREFTNVHTTHQAAESIYKKSVKLL